MSWIQRLAIFRVAAPYPPYLYGISANVLIERPKRDGLGAARFETSLRSLA